MKNINFPEDSYEKLEDLSSVDCAYYRLIDNNETLLVNNDAIVRETYDAYMDTYAVAIGQIVCGDFRPLCEFVQDDSAFED